MSIAPPPLPEAVWQRVEQRLRHVWAAWRHPPLRGAGLRLARGSQVAMSPEAKVEVGRGFVARPDLTLTVQGELRVGRNLFCNRGVVIAAMREVTIGDDVRLGERVSIIDHNHVIEPLDDLAGRFGAYEAAPIVIGNRVLIGANCVILAGARIGDDAVIGAGSVVRGEIPPGVLAVGAPAQVKRALRATGAAS
jgi:maltose O-acetyltransferase